MGSRPDRRCGDEHIIGHGTRQTGGRVPCCGRAASCARRPGEPGSGCARPPLTASLSARRAVPDRSCALVATRKRRRILVSTEPPRTAQWCSRVGTCRYGRDPASAPADRDPHRRTGARSPSSHRRQDPPSSPRRRRPPGRRDTPRPELLRSVGVRTDRSVLRCVRSGDERILEADRLARPRRRRNPRDRPARASRTGGVARLHSRPERHSATAAAPRPAWDAYRRFRMSGASP